MPSEDVLKIFAADPPMPKWVQDYYEDVILVDEKRLLESLATKHIVQVDEGTVMGERKVVIQEGKSAVEVEPSVWETWRKYEKRGKEEEKCRGYVVSAFIYQNCEAAEVSSCPSLTFFSNIPKSATLNPHQVQTRLNPRTILRLLNLEVEKTASGQIGRHCIS